MAAAQDGDTVKIHYTGTLGDGSVFDSSSGRDPLEFQVGSGQVIPGFDTAVRGLEVGAKKTSTIPAGEAYGQHQEQMVVDIPKTELPAELSPQVGQTLQATDGSGNPVALQVTAVADETITVDGNHPLAGKDLTFEIELVEIA